MGERTGVHGEIITRLTLAERSLQDGNPKVGNGVQFGQIFLLFHQPSGKFFLVGIVLVYLSLPSICPEPLHPDEVLRTIPAEDLTDGLINLLMLGWPPGFFVHLSFLC